MIRVTINDIDFLEEYGLYLIDREIGVAAPNLYQTTVPGRNGKLDLTDFYGDVTFQNRSIKMKFAKKVDKDTKELQYFLERKYSGQMAKVSFGDDEDYYWNGRLTIESNDDDTEIYQIEFTLDAHPFKYLNLYDKEMK